jgi:hypothetical protein
MGLEPTTLSLGSYEPSLNHAVYALCAPVRAPVGH